MIHIEIGKIRKVFKLVRAQFWSGSIQNEKKKQLIKNDRHISVVLQYVVVPAIDHYF